MTGGSQDQEPKRSKRRRQPTELENQVIAAIRAELTKQGIPGIPDDPAEVVPFAVLVHLVRCERVGQENSAELRKNTQVTEGNQTSIGELRKDMAKVLELLAGDLADTERRKKAWVSIKEFFATAGAVLKSRHTVTWVRIASAGMILLASTVLGPKVAHQLVDLKHWLELFF